MSGGVALLRRPPVVRGAIGRVELTQGQVAIFDPEDLPLVVGRSWCAIRARTECGFYATAWDPGLGRNLEMHRLLMGQPKARFVDHVNGNGLDNRRANLRLCTPSENLRNRIARKPAGASSQFLGVSLHRQSGRWQAQVRPEPGERINLGRFDQEIDAAVARDDFIRTHCPVTLLDLQLPDARRTRHQPREDPRMTATTDNLPPYNGEHVSRMQIKVTGAGTGFSGLDVRPVVMDLDEEMYLVVRVRAAESPSHLRDSNDLLVRMQRLHIEEMAPVSDDVASDALKAYAKEIEEIKRQLDGQDQLFAEQEAEAREELDETGTPEEIAAAAGQRAKQKP